MTSHASLPLKIAAVLWVVWGLVHMFAGIMTITQETSGAVAGIADAVEVEGEAPAEALGVEGPGETVGDEEDLVGGVEEGNLLEFGFRNG